MKVKTPQANLNFFVLPALIILLIAGAFYIGRLTMELEVLRGEGSTEQDVNNNAAEPAAPGEPLTADDVDPVSDRDHINGNRDAKIALIEYSDFECPFCQSFHPTAQQVVDNYEGEVMWVYRHFPLSSIHPSATRAAIASECIALQGGNDAFWDFADEVFNEGSALTAEGLTDIASTLGLNTAQFATCLENEETRDMVDEDFAGGQKAGITGTPGNILLNTETNETVLIPGALPYEQVSQAIDSLL